MAAFAGTAGSSQPTFTRFHRFASSSKNTMMTLCRLRFVCCRDQASNGNDNKTNQSHLSEEPSNPRTSSSKPHNPQKITRACNDQFARRRQQSIFLLPACSSTTVTNCRLVQRLP